MFTGLTPSSPEIYQTKFMRIYYFLHFGNRVGIVWHLKNIPSCRLITRFSKMGQFFFFLSEIYSRYQAENPISWRNENLIKNSLYSARNMIKTLFAQNEVSNYFLLIKNLSEKYLIRSKTKLLYKKQNILLSKLKTIHNTICLFF